MQPVATEVSSVSPVSPPILGLGLVALLLTASAPARAALPGEAIDQAIAVQITPNGLAALGDVVEGLVPPVIPVTALSDSFVCSEDDAAPLNYALEGLDLYLSVDDVRIDTADGRLDLWVYANLSSSHSTLAVQGDCTVLTNLDEECGVELPTTSISMHLGMTIQEVLGVFDVVVDASEVEISPIGNPLSDCTLASAFGALLAQNPEAVSGLLTDAIAGSFDDLGVTVEQSLEDALAGLSMDTEVALGDATVQLSLRPSLVELSEAGLVLGLGATLDSATLSDCVDWSGGSELSGAGWPTFATTAGQSSLEADVALYVGKDFVDHLLYMAWAGGLLCVDLSSVLGDSLTADSLSATVGQELPEKVGADTLVWLELDPALPPTGRFEEDGAPIRADLHDLGIEMYGLVDDRETRIFRVDLAGELGVDVALADGVLATALEVDQDRFTFDESYADIIGPGYGLGLGGLVGSLITGVIPSDGLPTLTVPSILGAELDALIWLPVEEGAWQGGFLLLDTSGVEPVDIGGCSLEGFGCDGGGSVDLGLEDLLGCGADGGLGCEGSTCATAPGRQRGVGMARARLGLIALLGALVVGRRRRG